MTRAENTRDMNPGPGNRLKLGTRGSSLAMAQSRLVAQELQHAHPGLRVDLIATETRGDRDLRTPLSEVNDANFFSAELDDALLNREVDFCVHSVKDLDADRPVEFIRAATPARENPRDVIVFRRDVIERLRQGQPIRIGSSSSRRKLNVERFLIDALPLIDGKPDLHFSPLRGAVDARLMRIHENAESQDALDGVVLALAGLNRLWRDPAGKEVVAPLLNGIRWMVLPPSACPTAAGQGALALECRRDDHVTRTLLSALHDSETARFVQRELDYIQTLAESGNSSFGVTTLHPKALGAVMYVRGPQTESNGAIWECPSPPVRPRAWDGSQAFLSARDRPVPQPVRIEAADTLFVAHWRAVTASVSIHSDTRTWVSGVKSWRQLARRGIWVEGCADNLGFAEILPTLACEVLGLPELSEWTALTHRDAVSGWKESGVGQVVATYATVPVPKTADLEAAVRKATHFFWGSAAQYRVIKKWVPPDAHHACGAGKTREGLRALGLTSAQAFPSRREWQAWLE
jgi:hydroxymethylbilane synthase